MTERYRNTPYDEKANTTPLFQVGEAVITDRGVGTVIDWKVIKVEEGGMGYIIDPSKGDDWKIVPDEEYMERNLLVHLPETDEERGGVTAVYKLDEIQRTSLPE